MRLPQVPVVRAASPSCGPGFGTTSIRHPRARRQRAGEGQSCPPGGSCSRAAFTPVAGACERSARTGSGMPPRRSSSTTGCRSGQAHLDQLARLGGIGSGGRRRHAARQGARHRWRGHRRLAVLPRRLRHGWDQRTPRCRQRAGHATRTPAHPTRTRPAAMTDARANCIYCGIYCGASIPEPQRSAHRAVGSRSGASTVYW